MQTESFERVEQGLAANVAAMPGASESENAELPAGKTAMHGLAVAVPLSMALWVALGTVIWKLVH